MMNQASIIRFIREEEATTAVEYAIMLAVIGIAVIKACQVLGGEMNLVFEASSGAMENTIN